MKSTTPTRDNNQTDADTAALREALVANIVLSGGNTQFRGELE